VTVTHLDLPAATRLVLGALLLAELEDQDGIAELLKITGPLTAGDAEVFCQLAINTMQALAITAAAHKEMPVRDLLAHLTRLAAS
jgi:hypothetical protein